MSSKSTASCVHLFVDCLTPIRNPQSEIRNPLGALRRWAVQVNSSVRPSIVTVTLPLIVSASASLPLSTEFRSPRRTEKPTSRPSAFRAWTSTGCSSSSRSRAVSLPPAP